MLEFASELDFDQHPHCLRDSTDTTSSNLMRGKLVRFPQRIQKLSPIHEICGTMTKTHAVHENGFFIPFLLEAILPSSDKLGLPAS